MPYAVFATLPLQAPTSGLLRYAFWIMGGVILTLVVAWALQRRAAAAASPAPLPASVKQMQQVQQPALKSYTVDQLVGKPGTSYAQKLLAQKAQLEALLADQPAPDPAGPTVDPATATGPAATGPAEGSPSSAPPSSSPSPASTAAAPDTDAPASSAPAEGSPQPQAPLAQQSASQQQTEEFARQLSCPPELQAAPRPAQPAPGGAAPAPRPKGRFAARARNLDPAATAQIQRARATTFFEPTPTGQFTPTTVEAELA